MKRAGGVVDVSGRRSRRKDNERLRSFFSLDIRELLIKDEYTGKEDDIINSTKRRRAMQYLKVALGSMDLVTFPELIFVELRPDRYDERRISFFSDGRVICSSRQDKPDSEGYDWLGEAPWDPLEELNWSNSDGYFVTAIEISAEAFERLWQRFHTGEKQKISIEEYERLKNEYPED